MNVTQLHHTGYNYLLSLYSYHQTSFRENKTQDKLLSYQVYCIMSRVPITDTMEN